MTFNTSLKLAECCMLLVVCLLLVFRCRTNFPGGKSLPILCVSYVIVLWRQYNWPCLNLVMRFHIPN